MSEHNYNTDDYIKLPADSKVALLRKRIEEQQKENNTWKLRIKEAGQMVENMQKEIDELKELNTHLEGIVKHFKWCKNVDDTVYKNLTAKLDRVREAVRQAGAFGRNWIDETMSGPVRQQYSKFIKEMDQALAELKESD